MIERVLSAIEPKLALLQLPSALQGNSRAEHWSIISLFWCSQRFDQASITFAKSTVPTVECRELEQWQRPAEAPSKAGLKGDRHSLVLFFSPEMHLPVDRMASKTAEEIFPWSHSRLVVEKQFKNSRFMASASAALWWLLVESQANLFGDHVGVLRAASHIREAEHRGQRRPG